MHIKNIQDFPIEQLFPIKDTTDLKLRVTVGKNGDLFWVESDIISIEGSKIIHHLGIKQNLHSVYDAFQTGLNFYRQFY